MNSEENGNPKDKTQIKYEVLKKETELSNVSI